MMTAIGSLHHNGTRAAIVDGVRTPFAKRATELAELSAVELGALCVSELLARAPVAADAVDRVVFGQVVPNTGDTNIARQIALRAGMPRNTDAYSVSRACATSYQSAIDAASAIAMGEVECVVAGGADSISCAPLSFSGKLPSALQRASAADKLGDQAKALASVHPQDLLPRAPAVADPFSGLRMGDAAEQMAKRYGISREAQDRFAQQSHRRAAVAIEEGKLDDEVMTVYVPPRYEAAVSRDNTVRPGTTLERYAELPPAFDERYGSVTAGNSSPLSDGAAALLMMRADQAQALDAPILGFVRAHAFVALDPEQDMLMGPAYAIPIVLERTGMTLSDLDLIDLHEAFSAQVLSVAQALESDRFAREELNRERRVGELDWDKVNVSGGSIAFGHPFAATGARQIGQTLRELKRRGGERALCAACAAGGFGAAMIVEVAQ